MQTEDQTAPRSRAIVAHGDLVRDCLACSGQAPSLCDDGKTFAYFGTSMLWMSSRWDTNTEK